MKEAQVVGPTGRPPRVVTRARSTRPPRRCRRHRMGCGEGIRPDERGAATGLLAALGLLFAMSLWCAVCLAGWWGCARTADDTADTAALAGAAAEVVGRDGCTVAEATARANGATLAGCTVDGAVVTVEVSVALRPTWELPGLPREVTRRAVAGPW